jgi:chromosome segregation ATPase
MTNLAQQLDETAHKVEENPLMGSEALEKLQELRNLMDELATDEMKQIMRKLSEALEEMNPSQQQRDLMAASFKQEEFMEKLDRMIDLFKKMQLKQKLEVAANQAEELVRQQTETVEQSEQLAERRLKPATPGGDSDQEDQARSEVLADREMRIEKQTEQLLSGLDGLSEQLLSDLDGLSEEMKEKLPNIAEILEQLTERAKQEQVSDQLQRAGSELKNYSPATSLPFQLNALSGLSQLQSDLQAALEAMEGQDASEIIAVLRDAIRSSLYVSHRHEEVMESTMAFGGEPEKILPKEREIIDSLAADEIDLAEGSEKVANQLKELSHKTASVRPELVWNLERVADGLNRSAAAMEDKLPTLAGPIQKNTLAVLNSAIEDMLNSIDQINAQAMPMMGLEDYMEQLRQLADQQSQLNQSTQDADNLRRKQGRTPSLEEMLEKLAVEQSLIREASERLAAKLDQLGEMLGRLEEVAREMQEVEDSLRQGSLSKNTIEKQRRILTRLLDYEKSLKKQDFSRKRQARAGREYTVEKPASILPADATRIQKQLDTMLSPSTQEQWPAQYRELIKMYYKALSNTALRFRTQDSRLKTQD